MYWVYSSSGKAEEFDSFALADAYADQLVGEEAYGLTEVRCPFHGWAPVEEGGACARCLEAAEYA